MYEINVLHNVRELFNRRLGFDCDFRDDDEVLAAWREESNDDAMIERLKPTIDDVILHKLDIGAV